MTNKELQAEHTAELAYEAIRNSSLFDTLESNANVDAAAENLAAAIQATIFDFIGTLEATWDRS